MLNKDDWEDLRDAVDNGEIDLEHLDSEEEYAMTFDGFDEYHEGWCDSKASNKYEEMFYGLDDD